MDKNFLLRDIPQVDEVLNSKDISKFVKNYPHSILVSSIRNVLDQIRNDIKNEKIISVPNMEEIVSNVKKNAEAKSTPHIRRVINATGVVLHTNFGRATLSKSAIDIIENIASNYINLEYDIKKGTRGSRHDHIEDIIISLTGFESCMVVNNNAAATMIVLSTIAKNREVIVSRGELIEIGGSFRIPEVMSESGAILKEVGTTNKTKVKDYENAYNENVAAFLKVHTSNYKVIGFTEEVTIEEMVELGKKYNTPVIYDLGSGLFVNLESIGINEPTIPQIEKTGVDIAMFSGDKLLGGPQAGIIVGKKKYIDEMKKNPLARILRVDKITIAALFATLYEYYDEKKAIENIPILNMLTVSEEKLKEKANKLEKIIKEKNSKLNIAVEKCDDQVGGGAAPGVLLNGYAVSVMSTLPAEKVERILRGQKIPIIVRVNHDKVLINVRCIEEKDFDIVAEALVSV